MLFSSYTFFVSFSFSFLVVNLVSFAIISGIAIKQIFFSDYIFRSAMEDLQKKKIFDFSSFYVLNPTKFSQINPKCLQWFIGFSEGDGNFGIIKSPLHQDRCSYCINQADLRVLKNIQEMLGFGNITSYKQKTKIKTGVEERIYGRFLVKNP